MQRVEGKKSGRKNMKIYGGWPACEPALDLKESKVSSINIEVSFSL